MSMPQLQSDLAEVKKAIPSGPLVTVEDLLVFIKHNLVPLIESHVGETAEIDEAVHDLVTHEADILHEETASVFASLVVSGREVAKELRARAGNDRRIIALVNEFVGLCDQGDEILNEITVPDDEDPEESSAEATNSQTAPQLPEPDGTEKPQ